MRVGVNTNNNQLYETARQVHLEKIYANSLSEYLKIEVTIPFLEEIVSQIKS